MELVAYVAIGIDFSALSLDALKNELVAYVAIGIAIQEPTSSSRSSQVDFLVGY
jgi:hypothetical protein